MRLSGDSGEHLFQRTIQSIPSTSWSMLTLFTAQATIAAHLRLCIQVMFIVHGSHCMSPLQSCMHLSCRVGQHGLGRRTFALADQAKAALLWTFAAWRRETFQCSRAPVRGCDDHGAWCVARTYDQACRVNPKYTSTHLDEDNIRRLKHLDLTCCIGICAMHALLWVILFDRCFCISVCVQLRKIVQHCHASTYGLRAMQHYAASLCLRWVGMTALKGPWRWKKDACCPRLYVLRKAKEVRQTSKEKKRKEGNAFFFLML